MTVWSAPNYCYRCGNVAAILSIDETLNRDFKLFREIPDHCNADEAHRRSKVPYFL